MDEILGLHGSDSPNILLRFTFWRLLPQSIRNALSAFNKYDDPSITHIKLIDSRQTMTTAGLSDGRCSQDELSVSPTSAHRITCPPSHGNHCSSMPQKLHWTPWSSKGRMPFKQCATTTEGLVQLRKCDTLPVFGSREMQPQGPGSSCF